ncbi:FCD domain-containing protein [Salinibacterium sp. G-O1]|uniref:FadR/GntR family transcriptional regulator n=1 Tax=Salinibacterium sp. G-O1 TaxID=3046208 RepID=UPI0024BB8F9D|nr:FCD domain-containing protein [Salinibacterium sp. G-O1]MDJ0336081.1 FCD domain-containing protein [Salinibacterium sp. G-O1]
MSYRQYLNPREQIVETIGRQIVQGTIGPIIDVASLETEFGVSRTLVRDAILALSEKNLVDAKPKRGTMVRPRSEWNLLDLQVLQWDVETRNHARQDLTEVRRVIEPLVAGLAAERRQESDIVALSSALSAMRESIGDAASAANADVEFHRAIARASYNDFLVPVQEVILVGLRVRDLSIEGTSQDSALDIHVALAEAIEQGSVVDAQHFAEQIVRRAELDETRAGHGIDRPTDS